MKNAENKAEINWQRRGLSPLPLQMGLIQAEYMRLQQMGLVDEEDLHKMLQGIKLYQEHPYQRTEMVEHTVWQQGSVRLLAASGQKNAASSVPLILIPSLINKADVLHITEEKSFMNWLQDHGVDCYLLDWGETVDDEKLQTMDGLIKERLLPAVDYLAAQYGGCVDALGYCMGGTLLAAAAQFAEERIRKAVFLASPWDFEAGDQKLRKEVRAGMAPALQRVMYGQTLPKDWIQSVFAAVNAQRALKKFSNFAAMDQDSDEASLFVAVEDWLNDGVDLPADLARTCIVDWYDKNQPGKAQWCVDGQVIQPQNLKCECFVVASENDVIVPLESSLSLAQLIDHAAVLKTRKGHIGMITGRQAETEVWQPVLNWLQS